MDKPLNKEDIIKIVKDEISSLVSKEIKNNNSDIHKEVINVIKDALTASYRFMWTNKNTWTNSIK